MTFTFCLIILLLNLIFFASSAGYYWLKYVDHYSTSINLVIFSFIQIVLFVYLLPIEDLVERVKKFGETTPKLYIFCLKCICPAFSLFLSAMAVYGDITNKNKPKILIDRLVCYTIFLIPAFSFLVIYLWNPFEKYDSESMAANKSASLFDNSNELKELNNS